MLAGAVACLVAFINRRRRVASCLGAAGFALLFVSNLLLLLLRAALRGPRVRAIFGVLLILLNAFAIILLIVAVLLREGPPKNDKEATA
jgi:hypothetical protein